MNMLRYCIATLGLLAGMTMSTSLLAAQFCVDSASGLGVAIANGQLLNQPVEIRVVQGTYNLPGGLNVQYNTNLTISGGWTAGCDTRSLNPALTTINGQNHADSAWLIKSSASITVEGLRLFQVHNLALILPIFTACLPGATFNVRRTMIQYAGDTGTNGGALYIASDCHRTRVVNNLITNAAGNGINFQCWGENNSVPPGYQISHNTVRNVNNWGLVAGPIATSSCGGLLNHSHGLYNNVLQSVRISAHAPVIKNNIYNQLTLQNGAISGPGSGANLTVDPQLDGNFRPITPGSPAINSGTSDVPGGLPGTDIEGTDRIIGTAPDRGAYESNVNDLFLISVTNNNNSGAGSLRAAIEQANASPTLQAIQFNIPGSCPQTINLSSPLPPITHSLIINGWSQSGASANNLEHGSNANICVAIRRGAGVPAADVPRALSVPGSASNTTLTVRGIAFGGFTTGGFGDIPSAIRLGGGSNHRIEGNQFGGIDNFANANHIGVLISGNASAVRIGGPGPGHRNTISNSNGSGVYIFGGDDGHEIINNYIGTRPDGLAAAPNQDGIWIASSPRNEIRDNLISGNTRDGVLITGFASQYNLIAGNRIGGRRFHAGVLPCVITNSCPPIPTNRKGVMIESDAILNGIGLTQDYNEIIGSPNVISHNTQHAVRIMSGLHNWVLTNSIFSIGGSTTAIDIGPFGVNPIGNDCSPGQPPYPANMAQNRPMLVMAEASGSSGTVSGTLTSCATETSQDESARNIIQFFVTSSCHSSGYGPGQTFVGARHITVPGAAGTMGTASFTAPIELPAGNLAGRFLTATATSWTGSTSEFSACLEIQVADAIFKDRFQSQ